MTWLEPSRVSVRWEGRIDLDVPDMPRFGWPASGFRLRFRGTELRARLRDTLFEDVIRDTDFLAVYVDDEAPRTVALH